MRRLITMVLTVVLALTAGVAVAVADEINPYHLESVFDSLSSTQAGAHADFTTEIALGENGGEPHDYTRDVTVRLPPGLFGNPEAFPKCTTLQLGTSPPNSQCPGDSQIGSMDLTLGGSASGTVEDEPVYDMPAPGGDIVARFGFYAALYPAIINVRLDPVTDTLVASVEGAPSDRQLIKSVTRFWGVPADPAHDQERLTPLEAFAGKGPAGGRKSTLPETPFMTNPGGCEQERQVTVTARSYQLPDEPSTMSALFPQMTGCPLVGFEPETSATPTTEQASTGSGLDYEAGFPIKGLQFANALYGSEAKRVEVLLPEGMTVNPSEAVGLGVCSEADLARETYDSAPNVGCPETSKIGSVTSSTPVLDRTLEGSLYLAKPYENPFGSLLALYVVLKAPDRGVLVKLAGKVIPDPATGRLTSIFDDIPQLPVGSFHLHFREGARAPLITPPVCGTFQTVSRLEPWSAPGTNVVRENAFQITKGIDNAPCPSGGVPPFAPTAVAGTNNNLAGSYSPLYLRIERKDGEQEITGFSTHLPPGLTANLTGVPFCGETEVQRAREQSGLEAETSPTCPAASQIGHTVAEAGAGTVLAQAPGKLYLAGPFEGAPFSVVDITSAHVGPFDLGAVVVRLPLRIDPLTAQASIPTGPADQIPHIIKGIVIHLRSIHVYVDRGHFALNPTGCKRSNITATPVGSGGDYTNPTDDQAVTVTMPFQAAECQALQFKPSFKASTSGKTSRKNGASLKVKLAYPKAPAGSQANIRSVKVSLPKRLPSRLSTLQQACTDSQFEANPAGCPVRSRVGTAKAITPILPVPLQGPAYFVSHGGAKFPELIVVLQGYGITIDLHGETFISKAGVTSSTFRTVPDQPVTSFELTLPQGKYSALAANGNLCATKLTMPTSFTAQNGTTIKQNTPITTIGCPKHKAKHKTKKARRKR